MSKGKMISWCAALLVSTSAAAQAGPTVEKSSEQIVCELSGDCAKVDPSLANEDQGASRGFRIATPGKPTISGPTPAPARSATPGRQVRPQYTAPQQAPRFAISIAGHSNLAINFVSGSARLTNGGRRQADKFLQAMKAPQLAGKRYKVIGHTDAVGKRDYNIDLSQRRAAAVVDYLVSKGASRSQFDAAGKGFDAPLNPANPKGAENRRVEFVKID